MRLDLFLRASRLCPRRTVAQELCEANLVLVNERVARSSQAIKAGDEITVRRRNRVSKIKVIAVPETRQQPKKDAAKLYELISETGVDPEDF
jgi:ribosomal 50S subunit-recycling heat shock protein